MSVKSLIATLLIATIPVHAGPAFAQQTVKPYTMSRSVQFDMTSKINGRSYRIFVHTPATPPPPGGYPVLYVTDGNGTFPVAAGQADINTLEGSAVMVVGIGYPTDDLAAPMQLRNKDLTPTPPSGVLIDRPNAKAADYGGGEAFYRFLTEELRPAIAATNPVNPKNQALYGHSLGGLFTLHVLFNHPEAFRSYIASSPSIWWNDREVLKDEAAFSLAVTTGKAAPRVLIEVGGLEESLSKAIVADLGEAKARTVMSNARMIGNVRDLADRLSKLGGGKGYVVRSQVFENEAHLSAVAASISRALAFADQD
ncbi:alpha/beta hydrolase [Novosphingobium sp. FKTRR1]|uniref:alpha/beta hydrolase n=1 Tax=Novosphingobium sp. FKTRR1 TaxID=2879118 RepID=UPI001CF0756B|nr:alpha/beta hydrolase-fold protein [Novosphingobium sp. FKTRR1]